MSTATLKDSLKNCLINFDRRVNVTELLQEYALTYEEVHQLLEEHLRQQEAKGVKYEKRFLVQGVEKDSKNEVYTVIQGEKNLQEWLERLQQAQSLLYTVEVSGGTKSPAYAFKALERPAIKLQSLKERDVKSKLTSAAKLTNGSTSAAVASVKVESKPEPKKSAAMSMFGKQTANVGASKSGAAAAEQPNKSPPSAKKSPPETKKSAAEEKKAKAAATMKKGIGNFFAPAVKKEENKKDSKPSSPQKDSFNKQSKKPRTTTTSEEKVVAMKNDTIAEKEKPAKKSTPPKSAVKADISVQLFDEESSDSSSDEESKLEVLKRNIISSDHEMDTDNVDQEAAPSISSNKRRRIVDSSDEEENVVKPKKKLELQDSEAVIVNIIDDDDTKPKMEPESEQPTQSETYLDEDGFVITVKPKKKGGAKGSCTKSTQKSPRKPSPAKSAAIKSAAKSAATAPKTKQGNIMSFFSKK